MRKELCRSGEPLLTQLKHGERGERRYRTLGKRVRARCSVVVPAVSMEAEMTAGAGWG